MDTRTGIHVVTKMLDEGRKVVFGKQGMCSYTALRDPRYSSLSGYFITPHFKQMTLAAGLTRTAAAGRAPGGPRGMGGLSLMDVVDDENTTRKPEWGNFKSSISAWHHKAIALFGHGIRRFRYEDKKQGEAEVPDPPAPIGTPDGLNRKIPDRTPGLGCLYYGELDSGKLARMECVFALEQSEEGATALTQKEQTRWVAFNRVQDGVEGSPAWVLDSAFSEVGSTGDLGALIFDSKALAKPVFDVAGKLAPAEPSFRLLQSSDALPPHLSGLEQESLGFLVTPLPPAGKRVESSPLLLLAPAVPLKRRVGAGGKWHGVAPADLRPNSLLGFIRFGVGDCKGTGCFLSRARNSVSSIVSPVPRSRPHYSDSTVPQMKMYSTRQG